MPRYKIKILKTANKDLDDMLEALGQFSITAALRTYDDVMGSIARLKEFPFMCEVYAQRKAYRRMVVEDWLVFYKVDEAQKLVRIYRVLNGKQDAKNLIK